MLIQPHSCYPQQVEFVQYEDKHPIYWWSTTEKGYEVYYKGRCVGLLIREDSPIYTTVYKFYFGQDNHRIGKLFLTEWSAQQFAKNYIMDLYTPVIY